MSTESSISASVLLQRLRDEDAHYVDALVSSFVDDLFTHPLRTVFPPSVWTQHILEDLRKSVEGPELRSWLEERIRHRLERLPRTQTPLDRHMSPALRDALLKLLSHPSTPSPELVRAIVDQDAVRNLLQTILKKTLTDFGAKLNVPTQTTGRTSGSGFGLRSKLMGVAKGVATVVSSELERQLEERVQSFLQGAMGRVIDMVVERLSDPKNAQDGVAFRVDAVDALLSLPQHHFRSQTHDLDPRQLADDLHDVLFALSQWEDAEQHILHAVEEHLGADLDRSLHAHLAESALETHIRARLIEQFKRNALLFFQGDAFEEWLLDVCTCDT